MHAGSRPNRFAVTSGHRLVADPATVHLRVDARATLRRAREAGRSGNPFEQVLGTFLRRLRPDRVDPVVTFDGDEVDAVVDRWGAEVDRGVNEGGLRFAGTTVAEIEPSGGKGIDHDEAKVELISELLDGSRAPIHLSYGPTTARTTKAQVDAVARQARAILGHGIRVTSSGHTFTATPAQIASALQTHVDGDRLTLAVDGPHLEAALRPQLDPIGAAPVDARFDVTADNHVVVVPSHDGLQPDLALVAARSSPTAPRSTCRSPVAIRRTTPRGRTGSASPSRSRASPRTTCPARAGSPTSTSPPTS